MAAKLGSKGDKSAAARKPAAAVKQSPAEREKAIAQEELDVAHPERVKSIGGRLLVVREYGYIEGMRIQAACKPFLDSLHALYQPGGAPPPVLAIADVFVNHVELVRWLIAQAITPYPEDDEGLNDFIKAVNKNAKWINRLNDIDGDLLTLEWWGATSRFFIRRLQQRALAERHQARVESELATPGSATP